MAPLEVGWRIERFRLPGAADHPHLGRIEEASIDGQGLIRGQVCLGSEEVAQVCRRGVILIERLPPQEQIDRLEDAGDAGMSG